MHWEKTAGTVLSDVVEHTGNDQLKNAIRTYCAVDMLQ